MDYKEQIEALKNLKAIAYGYNINGEVFGMDCSDFEQIMVDAADSIAELLARAEAAEARVEKAERERDAAVSDLEYIMAYGNSDDCQLCKNGQCHIRGGTKPCLPKWRGQKGE